MKKKKGCWPCVSKITSREWSSPSPFTCPEDSWHKDNVDNDVDRVVVMSTIKNKLVLKVEQIVQC